MTTAAPRTEDTDAAVVLRRYLDALTAGDVDAIADSFAEDATWHFPGTTPISGTKLGRDAIMRFLLSAGSLYELGTQSFSFGEVTAEAGRAVLEWRVEGVASATGRRYDNSYCGIFVIREGRIAEVREYLDTLQVAEVLFGQSSARRLR